MSALAVAPADPSGGLMAPLAGGGSDEGPGSPPWKLVDLNVVTLNFEGLNVAVLGVNVVAPNMAAVHVETLNVSPPKSAALNSLGPMTWALSSVGR